MTQERIVFDTIVDFINANSNFSLISAHPPNGKSYFTDLVRIPTPTQNRTSARRAHIDLIFCSETYLYLCELKGSSSESEEDIEKLREIKEHYSLPKLKQFISSRFTSQSPVLESCQDLALTIGCASINSPLAEDFLYILVTENKHIELRGKTNELILEDFNL